MEVPAGSHPGSSGMELALPEPCLTLPSPISSRGSDWDKIIRFPILQWDRGQGELVEHLWEEL